MIFHIKWKDEIDTKTNGLFTVHVHYGREKLKTVSNLRSKDVSLLNSAFADE
jgi:hypothetical protein